MIGFLAWIVIEAVLFVASALLTPKPDIPDANPEDPSSPRSEEGQVLPAVFGTVKISANVSFFGAVQAHEQTENVKTGIFSSKNVTVGYNYDAIFQAVVCHGPVDELVDIVFDQNKSLAAFDNGPELYGPMDTDGDGIDDSYGVVGGGIAGGRTSPPIIPATASREFDATPEAGLVLTMSNAEGLFGGYKNGGGLVGKLTFYWGVLNQAVDEGMQYALNPSQYGMQYDGVCHVVFGSSHLEGAVRKLDRFNYGERSILPGIEFIIRRCPSNLGLTAEQVNLGGGANPAEMIYEVLTDPVWGLAMPTSHIDIDSFVAAGVVLAGENFGLNISLNSDSDGDSTISEILRYIDGQVQQHPVTGLIELTLNRKDYDVETLPVLNTGNVATCNLTRPTWTSLKNEVSVLWTQRRGVFFNQVPTQPIQDIAGQRNFAEVNREVLQYPAVMDPTLANKLGVRDLRKISVPLGKVKLVVDRTAADFRVGRPFLLAWPDFGTAGRVHRVVSVDYGSLVDNKITVDAVEDVFALEQPLYDIPISDPFEEGLLGSRRLLEITPDPTEDASTGYLTLDVKSGTGLVTSVEFRTRSGNRAFSDWHFSTSTLAFSASVDKHSYLQSTILWRVNGHLQDGTIGILANGAVQYDVAQQPRRPQISVYPGTLPGYMSVRIVTDLDTVTVKYAANTDGSVPNDAFVRLFGGIFSPDPSGSTELENVALADGSNQVVVSALAYDEPGNESLLGIGRSLISQLELLDVSVTYDPTIATVSWNAVATPELSINGGIYDAAPASPFAVARPAAGGVPLTYDFRLVVGVDTIRDSITILPIDADTNTVTADLLVVPSAPTTTSQDFTVTASNPSGGDVPVITVTIRGTTGTGDSGVGAIAEDTPTVVPSGTVITVLRPFADDTSTQASIDFTAGISGGGGEHIQRTILNRIRVAPRLELVTTPGTSVYSIAYSGTYDTIELSINGAPFGAVPSSPIAVTRVGFDYIYTFRVTRDGITDTKDANIPAAGTGTPLSGSFTSISESLYSNTTNQVKAIWGWSGDAVNFEVYANEGGAGWFYQETVLDGSTLESLFTSSYDLSTVIIPSVEIQFYIRAVEPSTGAPVATSEIVSASYGYDA